MKGRPVDQLVYECMFPKARSTDPQNFHSLLHRHLIPEVRQEVHSFYGHLNTQEAKYPGLDYCHRIHRIRLSRWPWHRRLFRAFDSLRLTSTEISGLTKWEGTKWAKERFERDSGITIRDTASDEVSVWIEPEDRPRVARATMRAETEPVEDDTAETADDGMDGEEDSEGELESIGVALNERLRERAARREAGDTSEPLDEEWEQWLKNAIDSGELPFLAEQILQQSNDANQIPHVFFPPQMLSAARAGHWHEIPEFLHDMLRRTIVGEVPHRNLDSSSSGMITDRPFVSSPSNLRRVYSELRLPVGDTTATSTTSDVRLQRTAQPGA
ncbi:hypothetical protein MGN70_006464 [Eutypa lata]|uniref:Uncharacterized protein n=1 Tax=Eutypa lata (strain UCR-EL1) TaxID=1287681 RepID=M7S9S9_EUTLA|nr:hypothetical protein UCREL1_10156 [Eutypa lata UCREL1]KAI1251894.1 hypothetical protein MGN70_006464 [Eutypa lata]